MYKQLIDTDEKFSEIFLSFQGEGDSLGTPLVFIRLTDKFPVGKWWQNYDDEVVRACQIFYEFVKHFRISSQIGICFTKIKTISQASFVQNFVETVVTDDKFTFGRKFYAETSGDYNLCSYLDQYRQLQLNINLEPFQSTDEKWMFSYSSSANIHHKLLVDSIQDILDFEKVCENNKRGLEAQKIVIVPNQKNHERIYADIHDFCLEWNYKLTPVFNLYVNQD